MYIARIPNRNSPPTYLLRESYRENGKVKNRTLANLSSLPLEQIELLGRVLQGESLLPAGDAFRIDYNGSGTSDNRNALLMAALQSADKMGNGSAIFNLLRNLGGSFGVAFITTVLSRRAQFHQHHLAGELRLGHRHRQLRQRVVALFQLAGEARALADPAARRFDEGDPATADPIERVSSRPDFCVLMCVWPNQRTIADFPLSKHSPPTFFAHAKDDKTAPIAFAMEVDEKLRGLGVPDEMFVVDSGGHGAFHCGMVEGPGAKWPEALFPWLKKMDMWRGS